MKGKTSQKMISFSATTMGERGQVVIPVGIRKRLRIKKGAKFIVFLTPSKAVIFIPADQFKKIVYQFDKRLSKLRQIAK